MVPVGGLDLLTPSITLWFQLSATSAFEVKGSCKSQVKYRILWNKKNKKSDQTGEIVSLYRHIPPGGDMVSATNRVAILLFIYELISANMLCFN